MAETLIVDQAQLEPFWGKSFKTEAEPQDYIVERGLFAEFANSRMIDSEGGYNYILRGPGKRTLIQTIEKKIRRLRRIAILDVGCGTGRFLIDCATRWPGLVQCFGLTAYPYNRIYVEAPRETTQEATRRLGIDIRVGDAQRLNTVYANQQFDIITAVRVAQYLADPWVLVERAHEVLGIGGVAYINRILPVAQYNQRAVEGMSEQEIEKLYRFLEVDKRFENRMNADIIYRKLGQRLHFPIAYVMGSSHGFSYRFIG